MASTTHGERLRHDGAQRRRRRDRGAVPAARAPHRRPRRGQHASNEVTGGSPAYARKAIAWNAASGGAATPTANVVFDVPAATTVTYISGWNTAGTVRYFKKAVTSEAFGAQGTYTVLAASTSLDLNDA
jgi:hypothetical protein